MPRLNVDGWVQIWGCTVSFLQRESSDNRDKQNVNSSQPDSHDQHHLITPPSSPGLNSCCKHATLSVLSPNNTLVLMLSTQTIVVMRNILKIDQEREKYHQLLGTGTSSSGGHIGILGHVRQKVGKYFGRFY